MDESANNEMRIQYELKFRDLLLFSVSHYFLSPATQAVYLVLPWMTFNSARDGGGSLGFSIACAALFYLAEWAAIIAIFALDYFRRNVTVLTEHTLETRQDELVEKTPFTKLFVKWPGVSKVVTRPGFTGVYLAHNKAHVIPNRAFTSSEKRREFVAFVREKIRAAKGKAEGVGAVR